MRERRHGHCLSGREIRTFESELAQPKRSGLNFCAGIRPCAASRRGDWVTIPLSQNGHSGRHFPAERSLCQALRLTKHGPYRIAAMNPEGEALFLVVPAESRD